MNLNTAPPVLSFIIPTFNAASYILQTIDSIRSQGFDSYEIIISDDGSVDNTVNLISHFPKLRTITHSNCGPSAARNKGFLESRGNLIWFLDSDDILAPNAVNNALQFMHDHPTCQALVGHWYFINASGQRISATHAPAPELFESINSAIDAMLLRTLFPVGAMLTTRNCIATSGGWDEGLRCSEDRDLWLRMILNGHSFKELDKEMFCYRLHENNSTLNIPRIQNHLNQFTEKWLNHESLSESKKRKLEPYLRCLNFFFLAQKCIENTSKHQPYQGFVDQALEQLNNAPAEQKLLSQLLWESLEKPWEHHVRKTIWMKEKQTISEFNWIQFRCSMRKHKWFFATRYLTEILFHNPHYLTNKITEKALT